jgi:hypothetical protein
LKLGHSSDVDVTKILERGDTYDKKLDKISKIL